MLWNWFRLGFGLWICYEISFSLDLEFRFGFGFEELFMIFMKLWFILMHTY